MKKVHSKSKRRGTKKRVTTLATDLGLVVVSSLLSAATGFAAARDLRGAMIGATGGAALPLAYRAVLTHDSARRLGYGAACLAFFGVSFYLSWTRGGLGGVTPTQIAASAMTPDDQMQSSTTPPEGSPTMSGAGGASFAGLGAFGVGMHG